MAFSYSSLKEFKFISDFVVCFSFVNFSRGCKLVNIVKVSKPRSYSNIRELKDVRAQKLPTHRFL